MEEEENADDDPFAASYPEPPAVITPPVDDELFNQRVNNL